MKNVILIAPPAAGKGTQSQKLKEKYNMVHISMGDLLREVAKEESKRGKLVRNLMNEGKFASDELVSELLKERLSKEDCNNGFILDGYPRNITQAHNLEVILNELSKKIDNVLFLGVSKEEALKRVCGRRMCKECDAIYNLFEESMLPKREKFCNKCGSELYQRSDDNEETFGIRFDTYLEMTEPLIEYYKTKGLLQMVDSGLNKEYTFKQIEEILNID